MPTTNWSETPVFASVAVASGSAWSNASNAELSDNAYATSSPAASGHTNYLRSNSHGLVVPEGVIITGIEIEVEAKNNIGTNVRIAAGVSRSSSGPESALVSLTETLTSSDIVYSAIKTPTGWGMTSPPSISDMSEIYLFLQCVNSDPGQRTVSIDQVRMRVHYESPGAGFMTFF